MSTVISFNEYAPGTILKEQYSVQGIIFGTTNYDKFTIANDTLLNNGNLVLSGSRRGPSEFPVRYVRAKFTQPRHSRVEVSYGRLDPNGGTYGDLYVFDNNGVEIRHQRFPAVPGRSWNTASLTSSSTNISSFEIMSQSDSANFYIDNIAFDSLSIPQQPDFVLEGVSDIYLNPGETIEVPMRVTRLFGSHGVINFHVVNLPPGLEVVTIQLQPFVPGELYHIRFRAAAWSSSLPPVTKHTIYIEAQPSVASVGGFSRQVRTTATIREPYDVQLVGIEVTRGIQPHGLP